METEIFVVAIVFFSVVYMIKLFTDYLTRKRLIDTGLVDEKVKYLFAGYAKVHSLNNIKWGMILIAIGIPFLWRELAPYHVSGESVMGMGLILAGLAFVIFHFLTKSHFEKKADNNQTV
jgi:hypothetical protein